ncbi:MAG: energy-coupling factor transporter transmembrane protein EcfT [Hormoscilla sp. SP5CHS1]|nr:energy-coupling factor transporter transmembrane protein EcfT [Hormoscilla sp. SP12CHS1]MBC6454313.1 energy-coupling factor transporter transmembrane protein EcfT [Hormoscilla sp. SP5CHS1]
MDLLRSLPIGLYLEQPVTWLHRIDPRVKLCWLLSFLLAPILASTEFRIILVVLLMLLTLTASIPWRVWRQQSGWLLLLAVFVVIITAIAGDGLVIPSQPRLPANDPVYPQPTDYNYILLDLDLKLFAIRITRRSLDLGLRVATLIFTVIYSTNLYLLTTAPEEITAGIEDLMAPLKRVKVPVTEIALTLTLSLRFISLVLEEVQNLVRSVQTRAINWKKLGLKRSARVWLIVAQRLLENLLLRADQIASAMTVRGFTSPDRHRVQWHQLHLKWGDWLVLVLLAILWVTRLMWGTQAP